MSDFAESDVKSGVAMLQAGQFASAAELFGSIVQRDPANGPAFGYLGIALTRLGQTDQALQALGQASQLQPQEPAAQYNAAIGLMHAGRQQDATPFLQYTLQLDPTHAQARAALDGITAAQQPVSPPVAQTAQPELFGSSPTPLSGAAYPANSSPSPLSGPVYPASQPQGMHYTPTAAPRVVQMAPDPGTRLLRGVGWGAAYGQWWTAWNIFWMALYEGSKLGVTGLLFWLVLYILAFTVAGIVAGLIIAALPPSVTTGVVVGVVFGLAFCGLEVYLFSGFNAINIFFWFFTGRYVGANIAARVHRPIQQ